MKSQKDPRLPTSNMTVSASLGLGQNSCKAFGGVLAECTVPGRSSVSSVLSEALTSSALLPLLEAALADAATAPLVEALDVIIIELICLTAHPA